MSSFVQPPMASNHGNIGHQPRTPIKMERNYVYQPEVIRIERAPSVSSMVRPASCSPSPPPPPAPVASEVNLAGMPQPMAPLATSFQKYQPSFQYPQPPSWVAASNSNSKMTPNGGPRSFDDVDIALSYRSHDRILMHQHSASNLTTSGGTLPRLGSKGFMPNKQRPVAKIVANTRIEHHHQPQSLSDHYADPKMQLKSEMSNGSSCQELSNGGSTETFPFANDNVGTIRMRSNSHVQAMSPDEAAEVDNLPHPSNGCDEQAAASQQKS